MKEYCQMRMSKLFSQTLRDAPTEAEIPSHQLLLRAGFIRQLAAGIFSYLPLAKRSLTKIENLMREEIEAIGGQEIAMPVINPAEVWQETGRWYEVGSEMGRFKDKSGRDMVLAFTHEEIVADLVRKEIRSYRQLPSLVYHIQTKWRDDPRPRAGLIRVREFTMKDSYSMDEDWEGLDRQYRAHYQAYFNIFHRCGLPVIAVKSDTGAMGGSMAHEFMYITAVGEDTLLLCDACHYGANRQIARFGKTFPPEEAPREIEKVATPDAKTIAELVDFLKIPPSGTAKVVFMVATIVDGTEIHERPVLALVRGDMELNETKLANALKARELRPALEDEIRSAGGVPGYTSPIGLKNTTVVVDDAIPKSPNLVGGANEEGYHLLNMNHGRDYRADIVTDIVAAAEGDSCPVCGTPMRTVRGIEAGNIFKLGTRYSDAMGCTYLDRNGERKPVIMGSYGIGSGRLLASVAEERNDQYGLIWPITIAPYHVHMVVIPGKNGKGDVAEVAEKLYREIGSKGLEILFDDREESPGVKFMDADLIGIPLRLTIGQRSLKQGGVELKRRDRQEKAIVPIEDAVARIESEIEAMKAEIASKVVAVPYDE